LHLHHVLATPTRTSTAARNRSEQREVALVTALDVSCVLRPWTVATNVEYGSRMMHRPTKKRLVPVHQLPDPHCGWVVEQVFIMSPGAISCSRWDGSQHGEDARDRDRTASRASESTEAPMKYPDYSYEIPGRRRKDAGKEWVLCPSPVPSRIG